MAERLLSLLAAMVGVMCLASACSPGADDRSTGAEPAVVTRQDWCDLYAKPMRPVTGLPFVGVEPIDRALLEQPEVQDLLTDPSARKRLVEAVDDRVRHLESLSAGAEGLPEEVQVAAEEAATAFAILRDRAADGERVELLMDASRPPGSRVAEASIEFGRLAAVACPPGPGGIVQRLDDEENEITLTGGVYTIWREGTCREVKTNSGPSPHYEDIEITVVRSEGPDPSVGPPAVNLATSTETGAEAGELLCLGSLAEISVGEDTSFTLRVEVPSQFPQRDLVLREGRVTPMG